MKKNQIIIIILSVGVVLLLILCAFLYVKNEHMEELNEHYDDYIEDNVINNNKNDNSNDNTNNYISGNDALQVVLDNLGINKEMIYDLDNEFDYKHGTQVYDIDFKYNGYEYEFYVDAKTSKIIKSDKKRD